jgi:hypothetical protein
MTAYKGADLLLLKECKHFNGDKDTDRKLFKYEKSEGIVVWSLPLDSRLKRG